MSGPYTCSRCLIGTPNDNDMCDDCQEETMREADPMTTITIPPEALEAADEITALRAEVERLTTERDHAAQVMNVHGGRYWESLFRDEAAAAIRALKEKP